MSDTQTPPPSNQVTDEDLVMAVRQQCEKAGTPVVPTKQVSEADQIDVTSQTVKRRLEDIDVVNSIQVGRGHVWWVPEEEASARGEIDMSSVYLEELDPEDLPPELIRQHPEGPPSSWKRWVQKGQNSFSISLVAMVSGFMLLYIGEIPMVNRSTVELIGAMFGIGGLAILLVSMGIVILAGVLDFFDVPDPQIVIRRRSRGIRKRVVDYLEPD